MKKNYKILTLAVFCLFVFQNVVGQEKLKESKSKNASIISDYLLKNKQKYNLTENDLKDVFVNDEIYSEKTGVTHGYLNQTYKGIKIYNAISTVGIKNNKIFHYANKFKAGVSNKINTQSPKLNIEQAVQKAVSHFNLGSLNNLQFIESKGSQNIYSNGAVSQVNIPVELVYFQMPDESLRLSWDLSIYTLDSNHWWSVRVDAVTGDILDKNDWVIKCTFGGDHTAHGVQVLKNITKKKTSFDLFDKNVSSRFFVDGAQYNVYPVPIESPNHGPLQVVVNPADDVASPFGWHDIDGISGPEFTITRGNNVYAQDDINGDNGFGAAPDGTSSLNFNFPIDPNQTPSNSLDGATTNLFYWNNVIHDILYAHGFDELSGNFQENNYGKGGIGEDYVVADAQDGSDENNANFATPPDGSNPRMQMFLWNGRGISTPILTINNSSIAGGYDAALPSRGEGDDGVGNITWPTSTPTIADVVIVDDGTSLPEEGCNALVNGADLSGKIAFIRRGSCAFVDKIQNAQDAGAIAVIIGNHNNPDNDPEYADYIGMYGVTDPVFSIPSIFINFTDGQAIVDAIGNGETLNATIVLDLVPDVDASLDNGIIAHEYAHGISTRLTGGPSNSNCLRSNFQMGEGWSDWFALMVTMTAADVEETPRGIGTFAFSEPTDGLGIRLRHYTTDMAVNEFTYESTNDNTQEGTDADTGDPIIRNRRVHYIGSLWATMLWDLTWAYVDKYGFDPDLVNGTGGNNKVMNVVIEGLKLQVCDPEFIEGRDAILAADVALSGGEDQCLIWEVFARRGLGVDASAGIPFRREDQVNGFATPDPADASLANCTTLSSRVFSRKDFRLYPNPTTDIMTIKTGKNLGYVMLDIIDINGRNVYKQERTLLGEVQLDLSGLQSGLYILNIKGDYINANEKIIIK